MSMHDQRVPAPDTFGEVDPLVLAQLGDIIQLGQVMGAMNSWPTEQHSGVHFSRAAEVQMKKNEGFFELVQPLAEQAMTHYIETTRVMPDSVTLIASHETNAKEETSVWHRDGLFAKSNKYIVASECPTEFAVGKGVPLVNSLSDRLDLDFVVNPLIKLHMLEVEPIKVAQFAAFDGRHIHRRPALLRDGRVAVALVIYSIQAARDALSQSWVGRLQLGRSDRKADIF